jgi:hypothetical protein
MVVLQKARSTLLSGAGLSFSLTHRHSVARVTERVRNNFLNGYSDVKNITQAANRYTKAVSGRDASLVVDQGRQCSRI